MSVHELSTCCISHEFHSAASKIPDKIAVIHAAAGVDLSEQSSHLSDVDGARVSSSSSPPPIFDGDECFTYADILAAVDSFSRRIRRVLDGGHDPDLVRPKDCADPNLGHGDNDIHHSLVTSSGSSFSVGPRIVGVHIAPSVEYIVAVLSILRCGEAFLPLDPSWPDERIISIIASSRASLIIGCPRIKSVDGSLRFDSVDWIVERSGCSMLHLSMKVGVEDCPVQSDLVWPCEKGNPRKFCYLMYTSGSTGNPKGVCGTESGLLNRYRWMQSQYPICGDDVLLFKTSISFVDHLQEFFGAILTGAILVVPPVDKLKANLSCIVNLIKVYGISRLTFVPTLMGSITCSEISQWMAIRKSLKLLVLSGEMLSISLWKTLHGLLPETTILNLYGSTEVSGDCTYFDCNRLPGILEVESLSSVPIGLPISNCDVNLVGEADTADEGEIYVGGVCLCTGYFDGLFRGNSSKNNVTQLHFRTGDFAKRLKSGDLVFLGRKDRTIKVNGQRVALEEVENAIREHPEVSDTAVIVKEVQGGLSHLQAFYVMNTADRFYTGQSSEIDQQHVEELGASIREMLLRKLPLAMIPTRYSCIEMLPISASGKTDYMMLSSSSYMQKWPRNKYEKALPSEGSLQIIKEAFCDALLVEEVSDDDDFFVMGGNSISAAHAAYKLGIDLRWLYAFPTPIKLLKGVLDEKRSDENSSSQSPVPVKRTRLLDASKLNPQNAVSSYRLLHDNVVEGTPEFSREPNSKSSLVNYDNLLVGAAPMVRHFSLPSASGLVSTNGHFDQWISNLQLPFVLLLSRCNQSIAWGKRESNNAHQVRSLNTALRNKKASMLEAWKVLLKSCVDASPLVVYRNGAMHLFIGSHAHIFVCIDAITGVVQWEVKLEGRVECSAAITGDLCHVVVGCYKGKIYFLEYMTGNISWAFQTDGEVKMQPVLDKGRNLIWCGSHDHYLYALDYVEQCCRYKISCGGSIYGSPSINPACNVIYVASTCGRILGISISAPQFEVIWSYEAGTPIFGSLVMDLVNGNAICCLVDGHVLALNPGGRVIWKVALGGPIFAGACISSALPSQALICSRNGILYSLDTEGGEILWEYQVGDPITASAYVDEHSLFVIEPSDPCNRLACVCSSSGRIHVLRINSNAKQERALNKEVPQGQMVQEFAVIDLHGDIFSSPVMIGGRIFVGCRDDYVHCISVVT